MAPTSPIPYSATEQDLFFPCTRGNFFPGRFPGTDAALCAELCRLCYCSGSHTLAFDHNKIGAVLGALGFDEPQSSESPPTDAGPAGSGTHCLIVQHPARALTVIAFRGTNKQDPKNLLADANISPHTWERGGLVHAGFAGALAEVRVGLETAKPSTQGKLLITGHSLGAAMATLLASAWAGSIPGIALYTFGSPRVGDGAFLASLNGVTNFRCVDCCDGVTEVPVPVPLVIDYQHLGSPQYLDRTGSLRDDPGEVFIAQDRLQAHVDYVRFLKPGNNATRILSDHTPINYVSGVMGVRAQSASGASG